MSRRRVLLGCLVVLLATSCSEDRGGDSGEGSEPTLTVLAAASLAGVLEALPGGAQARFSFAGSPSLVAQVRAGAPADVIITASVASLQPLHDTGLVEQPVLIATNTVALVVPRANPGHVQGLADLARRGLRIALCDPSVPCGSAAATTLSAAGVQAAPDTLAPDVKNVLRLVSSGEADAGIVYASDARAAAATVSTVALAPGVAAPTGYPAAVVSASRHRDQARQFVESLLTPVAQQVLAAAGFGPP